MSTYWCEVRGTKARRGRPVFVTLDDLEDGGWRGFRSVYAYSDEVKARIEATGKTSDLGGVSVYSDTLFVDFDNQVVAAEQFRLWLIDESCAFSVWDSGNRSYHFHVPIIPMEGSEVPYSQRFWMKEQTPHADVSFYHQAGQFRLPYTQHEKTGQRKYLVNSYDGNRLEIEMQRPPRIASPASQISGGDFFAHLMHGKGEGGRRIYVWRLAMLALNEGLSYDDALRHILWWNDRYCQPPLLDSTVVAKVAEVYKKRGGFGDVPSPR